MPGKMQFVMRASSLLLMFSSFLLVAEALTPARPAIQQRANYNGGWALAIPGTVCPPDASVACSTSNGIINPNCCPSGQTCFGYLNPYCCPTDVDCSNVVTNLAVCANSTWNMYILDAGSHDYFCCEPGQYGVLPLSGYAGICEPLDQPVASSLIATSASQAGAPAQTGVVVVPATTGTVTSTLQGGGVTTILTTQAGSTATGAVTQTGTGSGAGSTGNGQSSGKSSTVTLSTGALAAIVVCAIVVPLACLVAFFILWRKRRTDRTREGPSGVNSGGATYFPPPQQVEKSPGATYVAPYAGEQHEYGKSELPPSEARQGSNYVVPPAVDSPVSLGRVEIG